MTDNPITQVLANYPDIKAERLAHSEETVEAFKNYTLDEFADEEQVDALRNIFNEDIKYARSITEGHKARIKMHIDMLEKFVKYPHSLRVETGQGYKDQ